MVEFELAAIRLLLPNLRRMTFISRNYDWDPKDWEFGEGELEAVADGIQGVLDDAYQDIDSVDTIQWDIRGRVVGYGIGPS
jgi:hypothetical protein